jgi:ribosomal silencing factor RsfS
MHPMHADVIREVNDIVLELRKLELRIADVRIINTYYANRRLNALIDELEEKIK